MKTQKPIIKIRSGALETNSSSAHAWVWNFASGKKAQDLDDFNLSDSKQLRLDFSDLNAEYRWFPHTIAKLGYFHNALKNDCDYDTLKELYRLLCLKTGAQSLLITHKHHEDNYGDEEQKLYGFFNPQGEFVLEGDVDVLMDADIEILNKHLGEYSLSKSKNAAESLLKAVFNQNLRFYQYHDGSCSAKDLVISDLNWGKHLAKVFGMEYKEFINALKKAFPKENPTSVIKDFAFGQFYGLKNDFEKHSHPFEMTWDEFTQTVKNAMAKKIQVCYYGVGHNE